MVLIVNQLVRNKSTFDFPIEKKIQLSLEIMFENHLDEKDNVALLTYGKNTKRIFSMVPVTKNKVQLMN